MEVVKMFKANNQQVFQTKEEAELKDAELELVALVESKGYSGMNTDAMSNIIMENIDEFNKILFTIRALTLAVKKIVEDRNKL